jgi:hypothetical protein
MLLFRLLLLFKLLLLMLLSTLLALLTVLMYRGNGTAYIVLLLKPDGILDNFIYSVSQGKVKFRVNNSCKM